MALSGKCKSWDICFWVWLISHFFLLKTIWFLPNLIVVSTAKKSALASSSNSVIEPDSHYLKSPSLSSLILSPREEENHILFAFGQATWAWKTSSNSFPHMGDDWFTRTLFFKRLLFTRKIFWHMCHIRFLHLWSVFPLIFVAIITLHCVYIMIQVSYIYCLQLDSLTSPSTLHRNYVFGNNSLPQLKLSMDWRQCC